MTTKSTGARILVVGLDMGDGPLIRYWARHGRLPHLAALAASGSWIELQSTARVLHTSTWPTFATGTLPGRHGVYYPYQPTPGHQLARHIRADQYGTATFWHLANARARRCLVYDVPETFPERDFHGRAIFDWGTWAWYGEPSAQPSALLKNLKARFGGYPLGYEAKKLAFGHPDNLAERLLRSVKYKQDTAKWLLDQDDWDLAVVGFCETHPAGHYLWPRDIDQISTATDPLFEPLLEIYAAIDDAIGALRNAVASDVVLLVVSGDGVRANRCGWHLLPSILDRLGYTSNVGQAPPRDSGAGRSTPSSPSIAARAQGLLSPEVKRRISAALPWRVRDRLGVWLQTRSIDWSRTRAFALPTDLEGCIRINVKGREPHGIVDPGSQYQQLCEEIRGHLQELENPTTGTPAVRQVWIRNEVFPGERQEELPDVIVTWNDDHPLNAVRSAACGLIEGANPDPRPGTHSVDGFLLAAGPGIPTGCHGTGHLTDVAPTVLALLGIGRTYAFDGRPLVLLGRASDTEAPAPVQAS